MKALKYFAVSISVVMLFGCDKCQQQVSRAEQMIDKSETEVIASLGQPDEKAGTSIAGKNASFSGSYNYDKCCSIVFENGAVKEVRRIRQ